MMILDRTPYHKAKIIQDMLKELDGEVELEFLPPGCPDLNAIEEVWRQVKHAIQNITYMTVAGMHDDIAWWLGSSVPVLDTEKYLYLIVWGQTFTGAPRGGHCARLIGSQNGRPRPCRKYGIGWQLACILGNLHEILQRQRRICYMPW